MSDTPRTNEAEASALEVGQWHLAKLCRELERENAALRERLDSVQKSHFSLSKDCAALREDKARLDWLAVQHRRERQSMSEDATKDEGVMLFAHDADGMFTVVTAPTFRAAIDAARKEAQP